MTKHGGEDVEIQIQEPVSVDVRKTFQQMMEEEQMPNRPISQKIIKQGKNEPCRCGSGKNLRDIAKDLFEKLNSHII